MGKKKQCRFCGEKIFSDTVECPGCGKTLIANPKNEKIGLTDINSWQGKRVPAWVMYAVVGFFLFALVLMLSQGCKDKPADNEGSNPIENKTESEGTESEDSL